MAMFTESPLPDKLQNKEAKHYPTHYNGVKALMDTGIQTIPTIYLRPQNERPLLVEEKDEEEELPLIDLSDLEDQVRRPAVVENIGKACQTWGFFLAKNHGIPSSTMASMMSVARDFFDLPTQEKMRHFSTDPKFPMRYATSFNVIQDIVLNWRDFLRYSCHPLQNMMPLWPDNPKNFKEVNAEYCTEIRKLGKKLLEAISESLGLERSYINDLFEEHSQIMACNMYPSCPNPDLTLGFGAHSDPGGITMLMQDGVGGLQVLKGERWVNVKPIPDSLVVNMGDMLQILSNGKYKSAEHRVVVSEKEGRFSVPTAFGPSMDAFIAPAPQLVDEGNPAVYRGCVYGDFMLKLQSKSLLKKSVLDSLRVCY